MKKSYLLEYVHHRQCQSGFTLIELLIGIVISSIVMSGLYLVFVGQQSAFKGQEQMIDMQQNLRSGMYFMLKEIRMAGYDPYGTSGAGITNAGDGSYGNPLRFTLVSDSDSDDNDNDGTIDEKGELKTIEYQLFDAYGTGAINIGRKEDNGNYLVISENISPPDNIAIPPIPKLFIYLDRNGMETAILSDIKSIVVSVTATPPPNREDYSNSATRTLTSAVKCRNL
ncbi:MAG: prepilin-type N-terminal cleavage/methylation domain-containing protein [Pseudomonadota bacterium]